MRQFLPHLEICVPFWGGEAGLAGVFLKCLHVNGAPSLSCPGTSGIGGCKAPGRFSIAGLPDRTASCRFDLCASLRARWVCLSYQSLSQFPLVETMDCWVCPLRRRNLLFRNGLFALSDICNNRLPLSSLSHTLV